MAVASPVLERKAETKEERKYYENPVYEVRMTSDEIHNASIGEKYARLINPESTVREIVDNVKTDRVNTYSEKEEVYLVKNARADAQIFFADSPVNRVEQSAEVSEAASIDEEENEDLRPTATTIQYRTAAMKSADEGKVRNTAAKRMGISKRDKIIIAIALTVIIALFVLIIVNSAVISHVNSDLGVLQSSLTDVKGAYEGVRAETNEFLSNIAEHVQTYAAENGMTR